MAPIEARALAARLHRSSLPVVPYRGARLVVSGEVFAPTDLASDLFDVVTDERGRTSAFLVSAGGQGTAASLVATVVRAELRSRLRDGRTLDECFAAVARGMGAMANDVVRTTAIGVIRVSADGHVLECANAGLAPIVIATPGVTRVVESGGPSLGLRDAGVSRMESMPAGPGTSFLLASDGLAPGTVGPLAFARIRAMIEERGAELAAADADELRVRILETAALAPGDAACDDVSLVVGSIIG